MKTTLVGREYVDFRKRFAGVFGFLSMENQEPLLVQVMDVNVNRVLFVDANNSEYSAKADAGVAFEFLPVDRKVVNTDKTVLYMCRKPARQWQRGVCAANTSILDVVSGRNLEVSFKTVAPMWGINKNYATQLNEYLMGTRKSLAISDRFSIVGDKVFLFDVPIGRKGELQNVFKIVNLFKQEFSDCVQRKNLPFFVELSHE